MSCPRKLSDGTAAMESAMAFMKRDTDTRPNYPGHCHFAFNRDVPGCGLRRGYRTAHKRPSGEYWEGGAVVDPEIFLFLRSDWRRLVYDRGLSYLPAHPSTKPVFILHAEEGFARNCITVAKAYWTPGGRVVKQGFLAWRVDYWERNHVLAWAVGSTEQRAVNKMQKWPAPVETALVDKDDADALQELFS